MSAYCHHPRGHGKTNHIDGHTLMNRSGFSERLWRRATCSSSPSTQQDSAFSSGCLFKRAETVHPWSTDFLASSPDLPAACPELLPCKSLSWYLGTSSPCWLFCIIRLSYGRVDVNVRMAFVGGDLKDAPCVRDCLSIVVVEFVDVESRRR